MKSLIALLVALSISAGVVGLAWLDSTADEDITEAVEPNEPKATITYTDADFDRIYKDNPALRRLVKELYGFAEPNEPEMTFTNATVPPPHSSILAEIIETIPTWPEYYEVKEDISISFDHPDTEDFIDMNINIEKGTKIYKGTKQ